MQKQQSTLAALGRLATAMVKGFSPESALALARSSPGRIVLHLVCRWQDRRFLWHWRGIQREFIPSRRTCHP